MARNFLAENAPPLVKADQGSGNNLCFSQYFKLNWIENWDSPLPSLFCISSVSIADIKECLWSHFNSIWDGIGYDFGRMCKTSLKAKIRFQEFARSCWISFYILDLSGQNLNPEQSLSVDQTCTFVSWEIIQAINVSDLVHYHTEEERIVKDIEDLWQKYRSLLRAQPISSVQLSDTEGDQLLPKNFPCFSTISNSWPSNGLIWQN